MVGVEISKLWFKAVRLDANGKLDDVHRYPIGGDRNLFSQLIDFIKETKARFGNFGKIGIAVPGLVHHETKRVTFSTFIPEHETIDFLGEMEAATNLEITVENDANAAGYGEFVTGGSFLAYVLFHSLGLAPLLALPVAAVSFFAAGWGAY